MPKGKPLPPTTDDDINDAISAVSIEAVKVWAKKYLPAGFKNLLDAEPEESEDFG